MGRTLSRQANVQKSHKCDWPCAVSGDGRLQIIDDAASPASCRRKHRWPAGAPTHTFRERATAIMEGWTLKKSIVEMAWTECAAHSCDLKYDELELATAHCHSVQKDLRTRCCEMKPATGQHKTSWPLKLLKLVEGSHGPRPLETSECAKITQHAASPASCRRKHRWPAGAPRPQATRCSGTLALKREKMNLW